MKNSESKRGVLVVISGPSGAGKGTVLSVAFSKNRKLRHSISATTRQPRDGEVDGKNYFFKTRQEFLKMVHNGEFLEYQEVYGNYYGTPKNEVEKLLDKGFNVVLEIDVKGAMEIKNAYSEAILIFLTASRVSDIRERLIARSTETQEQLMVRISAALEEIKYIPKYDYVIINDIVEDCSNRFLSILKAEKFKVHRNKELIQNLISEVNEL